LHSDVTLTTVVELYDRFNRSEQAGLKLFSVLATVCLLISLFGIYAVAASSTQRRRKEIAIRKVVGAEAGDIVRMFFREYTMQVIVAGVIALPLAYYAPLVGGLCVSHEHSFVVVGKRDDSSYYSRFAYRFGSGAESRPQQSGRGGKE
jgi:ABC-type antimicrobial peptide transport system permease subunit